MQAGGPPSEDELAAIVAAVDAYIAIDDQLHMSLPAADKSMSPWLVASRLQSTAAAQPLKRGTKTVWRGSQKTSLWGNLFSFVLVAASLSISLAPQAVAQGKSVAAGNVASYYSTWNYNDNGQTVRVLLGAPRQKVDLDLPDGGSIYSTDGTLVAKIGPRSSWSLNLASSAWQNQNSPNRLSLTASPPRGQKGPKFVFTGKGSLDTATTAGLKDVAINSEGSGRTIQRTSFVPQGFPRAIPMESRFALGGEVGYLIIPDARSSEGAVPLVGINGQLYRGSIFLRPFVSAQNGATGQASTTSIGVINIVKIEDYLLSVVPSEVPSSWPVEVLKAQAIAARSYVVANLGKHKADGYDVKDTVEDQVYRGVISENDDTNVACAKTAGLVLKQNDQVISAFFHSTSGGSTELAENVWSKPLPYLKSVVDYDDASPHFNWERSFTVDQLNKLLGFQSGQDATADKSAGRSGDKNGDKTGSDQISAVFVVGRHKSDAQRVKHVAVVGTSSGRLLTGSEMRKLLNLPSTQFSVYQADGAYVFSGRGNGHGLGLSQWGAKALADKGYNAGQILSYYYKDVTIESMAEPAGTNGSI
jgi:stage II sporulation protein D